MRYLCSQWEQIPTAATTAQKWGWVEYWITARGGLITKWYV